MEDIIYQYGPFIAYMILLCGSFVEGESFVLTAGFLAYKGFLSFPIIVIISFLGSLCADQIIFHIGRHYGPSLLDRRPFLKERSKRVFTLLHCYNTIFILGFRFVYGIRTISPLVIGASGISVKRFTILNFLSALIWSILSCSAGYLLGYFFADTFDLMMKKLLHYQEAAAIGLLGLIIAIGVYVYLKRHHKRD